MAASTSSPLISLAKGQRMHLAMHFEQQLQFKESFKMCHSLNKVFFQVPAFTALAMASVDAGITATNNFFL